MENIDKKCRKCNEVKPFTEEFFNKCNGKLRTPCKECNKKQCKEWSRKNPNYHKTEVFRNAVDKWQKANKQRIQEVQKIYREENRERIEVLRKAWMAAHPGYHQGEERKAVAKIYRETHKEEIAIRQKQYIQDNIEAYKEYQKEYHKEYKKKNGEKLREYAKEYNRKKRANE